MILELDCGNSFIKWRVIRQDLPVVLAGGVVDSDERLVEAIASTPGLSLRHSRMVSVRNAEETQKLTLAIADSFGLQTQCASSAKVLAGVKNGYEAYERLGLDRWLALVGAYSTVGRSCLVLDLGTAVTSDFVNAQGEHLGGFICPGMPLMRGQLRTHTRRIRYDDAAAEEAHSSFAPGRSTAEAVERGCALMLRGFAVSQLELAHQYWGDDFVVFVTGGDAELVKGVTPGARLVPDLVFVGLALACPLL
ncbi:pantothenate kinase [Pseudomonas quasicaspiana]|uniref:pantothenate kinase n=1 Tax=Pseudomonas quasicaspiana TaxID=2829821 RepID=UPI001E5E5E4A|nr:pantothenate kinase [Pseudomonas quasicaspiana]MCD5972826.1 pantothenate kinase [Pseudomonas quasicaspiana]